MEAHLTLPATPWTRVVKGGVFLATILIVIFSLQIRLFKKFHCYFMCPEPHLSSAVFDNSKHTQVVYKTFY